MRYSGLALAGVFVACLVAAAQQPQQQPQQPPAAAPPLNPANRLDALLLKWQDSMQKMQSLEATCVRKTLNKTFNSTEEMEGKARYMRPNLASLELVKRSNPGVFEKFICSGTFLYEFVPAEKVVRVHELPKGNGGQIADDNFLSFLFGMKAEEAKRRYDLQLEKEDQHWVYIRIHPRFPADKADFQEAQLVLGAQMLLPRRLWFQQPNGNEVTWDIPVVDPNARINRAEFALPALPRDWQLKKVPQANAMAQPFEPPPRVVRPQQGK